MNPNPSESTACETHRIALSALLDGELDAAEVLVAVDHLSACEGCRDFYRRARVLGEGVSRARSAETSLEDVWGRVVEETSRRRRDERGRKVLRWAPRLAAVLLLGVGVWVFSAVERRLSNGPGNDLELKLGSASGQMTDARFVELATEVLTSDLRYQRKMLEVMTEVSDAWPEREGSPEDRVSRREGSQGRVSLSDAEDTGGLTVTTESDFL